MFARAARAATRLATHNPTSCSLIIAGAAGSAGVAASFCTPTECLKQQPVKAPVVGLEAFASGLPPIIAGKKAMSVRPYPLPPELIGKPLLVLATADPPEGGAKNIMPDHVPENAPERVFQVVGVVVFSSGSKQYETRAAFDAEAHLHGMVPGTKLHAKYAGSGSGWPGPQPAFGWAIQSVTALSPAPTSTPAVRRRYEGTHLFEIESDGWEPERLLAAKHEEFYRAHASMPRS